MKHAINWFEIPVTDIERATEFYSTIFDVEMSIFEPMPGFKMAQFPTEPGTIGGALLQGEGHIPNKGSGVFVYLNGGDDLQPIADRVEGAGGELNLPKTDIGENGFMAFFIDTEGNKIGLHSMG